MKILVKKRSIAILLLMALFSLSMSTEAYSQKKKKKDKEIATEPQQNIKEEYGETVALVVSGTGATKEEATNNALRSALEQAYGTFVSANTQVINDEIIKDEIASISSGNIQGYKEISCINSPNGEYDISLRAVVSISKLVSFAQSHGMSAELSGQTFLLNRNMALLNKKNEALAIQHLRKRLLMFLAKGLFDFSVEVGTPRGESSFRVPVTVKLTPNKNMDIFLQTIDETLQSLSMSDEERENYRNMGMEIYHYSICERSGVDNYIMKSVDKNNILRGSSLGESYKTKYYSLRNQYGIGSDLFKVFNDILYYSKCLYTVYDNIGTNITPCVIEDGYNIWSDETIRHRYALDEYHYEMITLESQSNTKSGPVIGLYGYSPYSRSTDEQFKKQEFYIIYTYDEISKLQNISIKPCLDVHTYNSKKQDLRTVFEKMIETK